MKTLPLPHKHATRYRGKIYSTYHVRVTQSGVRDHEHDELCWQHEALVPIIATSPVEAIYAVRDELVPHLSRPTEFECAGPRGGIIHRFLGWESIIGLQMFSVRPEPVAVQLPLFGRAA